MIPTAKHFIGIDLFSPYDFIVSFNYMKIVS